MYAEGPCCIILANPQRFVDPIPYLGRRGLFDVPDEVLHGSEFAM